MLCNRLSLTLSPTSKIRLLEECSKQAERKLSEKLKSCCLCNFVGDNCDIRIKPRVQSSEHQIKDCHYFAILLVFARLATEITASSNMPPAIEPLTIDLNTFVLNEHERFMLLDGSYKILLGRMMAKNFPAFKWLSSILPKHIPHPHSQVSSLKSEVHPFQLSLKNEAKYEDCVEILSECSNKMYGLVQDSRGKLFFLLKNYT